MGRLAINYPDGRKEYIKAIDNKHLWLDFTDNPEEALTTDYGEFFTTAKARFVRFHYRQLYPQVNHITPEPVDDDEFPG